MPTVSTCCMRMARFAASWSMWDSTSATGAGRTRFRILIRIEGRITGNGPRLASAATMEAGHPPARHPPLPLQGGEPVRDERLDRARWLHQRGRELSLINIFYWTRNFGGD